MKRMVRGLLLPSQVLAMVTLIFLSQQAAQAASWMTNGPMAAARFGQTATLLPNGKVLVAGGCGTNGVSLSSAELYDPATGTWTTTGSLNEARYYHTATLLPNGKVLVVGGVSISPFPASVTELYDPGTGIWTPTSLEAVGRHAHTATLLSNGKVLVVGGYGFDGFTPLSSAVQYDPSTETWADAGTMIAGHAGHTATLLPNGKVLITGGAIVGFGVGSSVTNTVELYNPADGTWAATGPLNIARNGHTATLLQNGLVLVTGGYGTNGTLASAEVYNPSNETWTVAGSLNDARYDHSATMLPDGEVLIAGGEYSGLNTNVIISTAELYSPSDGTWTSAPSLNEGRYVHTATLMPGGNVLITGGIGTNGIGFFPFPTTTPLSSTEVYDPTINPATGTWMNTGTMNAARWEFTATLLPDGQVLAVGGFNASDGPLASAEIFDPSKGTWTATSAMNGAHWIHTATLLPNGKVLVAGGGGDTEFLSSTESFDPVAGIWTTNGEMAEARYQHTATLLPNGKVLVVGGHNFSGSLASAELFDPAIGNWTVTGSLNVPRQLHTATSLPNGNVLIVGGQNNTGELSSAELYDPATGTWSETGPLATPRDSFTATLLPDGNVLAVGGYNDTDDYVTNAELYDAAMGMWTNAGSLILGRYAHTAMLLPDGKVLVAGGAGATGEAELYDPAENMWTSTGELNLGRFLQTMTLLSDGKVLIAGGYASGVSSSAELFDVGLGYSNAWQPRIKAVTSPLKLGFSLVVTGAQFRGISGGSGGNTQDSATDYPLVQLRSLDSGQTTFLLTTNRSTNSVTSAAVWNFPPGYALATVFVNGIQSTSSIVNISIPVPVMTRLAGSAWTNGTFQLCFTNSPGALLGVLTTTNLSVPLTNWTRLGSVMEVAPGQYQFTDPQATNGGQRFYSLFAP